MPLIFLIKSRTHIMYGYEMQNCVWVSLCERHSSNFNLYIIVYYHGTEVYYYTPPLIYIKLTMCVYITYSMLLLLSFSFTFSQVLSMGAPTIARLISFSWAMQMICNFGKIQEFFLCRLQAHTHTHIYSHSHITRKSFIEYVSMSIQTIGEINISFLFSSQHNNAVFSCLVCFMWKWN